MRMKYDEHCIISPHATGLRLESNSEPNSSPIQTHTEVLQDKCLMCVTQSELLTVCQLHKRPESPGQNVVLAYARGKYSNKK